jgi:hypothetical protein
VSDKIELIMKDFDFTRVWKAMVATDWKWSDSESVPSITELKSLAKKLLADAEESKRWIRCGGFEADYNEGNLYLAFVLEHVDYEGQL